MKACNTCGETKPLDGFYPHKRMRDGYFNRCKLCDRVKARESMRRLRDEDPARSRTNRLRSLYGLTPEGFADIFSAQRGGCAICGATDPGGKGAFHVDHDHSCCPGDKSCGSCVRGLLCHGCNTGLGSLGEDVDRLVAAAAYLMSRRDVLAVVF